MKSVLELAQGLDITNNPDLTVTFESGNSGFHIFCTPEDHPDGWERETITHLGLSTMAYELSEQKLGDHYPMRNRPEDVAWANENVTQLFKLTDIALMVICIAKNLRERIMGKHTAHPSNPHYYPYQIYDAPDLRLHGRLYRKTDLENTPAGFFPNGTVFQHRKRGHLRLFWDGALIPLHSLDDPIPSRGNGK